MKHLAIYLPNVAILSYLATILALVFFATWVGVVQQFNDDPVGYIISFKSCNRRVRGEVIAFDNFTFLVKCSTGIRYRYVPRSSCTLCFWYKKQ
jgi:hypothetical protein